MSMRGESDIRKAQRGVIGLAVAIMFIAVSTVAVRASFGFFSGDYEISATFPQAGTGLQPGSEVQYRGVSVGKVQRIQLVDRRAKITLKLHHDVKIPRDAIASIEPKTLFGDQFVNLRFPGGAPHGPYLKAGEQLKEGKTGAGIQDLIEGAAPLGEGIAVDDLGSFLGDLTTTIRGHGAEFGQSLDLGAKATTLIQDTLGAQTASLDALDRFLASIDGIGPKLRTVIDQTNRALPVFTQARATYDKALTSLKPLADDLASFVSTNRIDFDRIFDHGGDLIRVLLARHDQIGNTINGLYRFLVTISELSSADRLPNGSATSYVKLLIDPSSVLSMVCQVLTSPVPLPGLAPLQQQLFGALGNPLQCHGAGAASPPTSSGTTTSSPATGAAPLSPQSIQALNDATGSLLATPDRSDPTGLGAVLGRLTGTGTP